MKAYHFKYTSNNYPKFSIFTVITSTQERANTYWSNFKNTDMDSGFKLKYIYCTEVSKLYLYRFSHNYRMPHPIDVEATNFSSAWMEVHNSWIPRNMLDVEVTNV